MCGGTSTSTFASEDSLLCWLCLIVDLIPPEENIKEFADAEDRLEDSELM